MEFDTTGTTYYHDNAMSPWSVPEGRVAIFVPRPTPSLDRYFDRTDNALQKPITGLESATAASALYVGGDVIVPDGTVQIAGNMFMAGDGVNMTHVDIEGESGISSPLQGSGVGPQSGGSNFSAPESGGASSSQGGASSSSQSGGSSSQSGGSSSSENSSSQNGNSSSDNGSSSSDNGGSSSSESGSNPDDDKDKDEDKSE
jgi:hypothetical protein